jgi:hypothetical protein
MDMWILEYETTREVEPQGKSEQVEYGMNAEPEPGAKISWLALACEEEISLPARDDTSLLRQAGLLESRPYPQ